MSMQLDVASVQSAFSSPFDDVEATTAAITSLALLSSGSVALSVAIGSAPPGDVDARSSNLVSHFRSWLDTLLFVWASPSPIPASDPRRDVMWLELQLASMSAIETVLCFPVTIHSVTSSSHRLVSMYQAQCELDASTASFSFMQPFHHWVNAFVSMLEKELHVFATELHHRVQRPKRNAVVRRLEALCAAMSRLVGIAESEGGLLLQQKMLESSLLWQNLLRVLGAGEASFAAISSGAIASPIHEMTRRSLEMLLMWWSRALSLCIHIQSVEVVALELLNGGEVVRQLMRLMCFGRSATSSSSSCAAVSTPLPFIAALLSAQLSHAWWARLEREIHQRASVAPAVVQQRMSTLLRLMGGCAVSDSCSAHHGMGGGVGSWQRTLQFRWVQVSVAAAHSISYLHTASMDDVPTCELCSTADPKRSTTFCCDVMGNFRLMLFFLEQRCESATLLAKQTVIEDNDVEESHTSSAERMMAEAAALLLSHHEDSSNSAQAHSNWQELLSTNSTAIEEITEVVLLFGACCQNAFPFRADHLAASIRPLGTRMFSLLASPLCIKIAVEDKAVAAAFCLMVQSRLVVDGARGMVTILAASLLYCAKIVVGVEQRSRLLTICATVQRMLRALTT